MKVGIMQPYFFPYIGYWQLMNAVDRYVIYDNIQYEKAGWINRNRILVDGHDKYIGIPLKKDSDYLEIRERRIADSFRQGRVKMLNRIIAAYRKAPQFEQVFPIIKEAILFEDRNLFQYLYRINLVVAAYLDIRSEIIVSSTLNVKLPLKGKDRVIATCEALGATDYYNAIGGRKLYDPNEFKRCGINLKFLRTDMIRYRQFDYEFVPFLSIIDVMMFNSRDAIRQMLEMYTLE